MYYVIDFAIASLLYLSVTAYFYLRNRNPAEARRRIFTAMLLSGIGSLVVDIAAVFMEYFAAVVGNELVYISNALYLSSLQFNSLLFMVYVLMMTGGFQRMNPVLKVFLILPSASVIVLTLCSFLLGTDGVFYIDAAGHYVRGTSYMATNIPTAMYLISAIFIIVRNRKSTHVRKRVTITFITSITVAAFILQTIYRSYLVNTTANAVSLVLIYHILQAPNEHIDPMTRLINRSALPDLLDDVIDSSRPFVILIVHVPYVAFINSAVGDAAGDETLVGMAETLRALHPNRYVVRYKNCTFIVIDTHIRTPLQLKRETARIKTEWNKRAGLRMPFLSAILFSRKDDSVESIIDAIELVRNELKELGTQEPIFADDEYRRALDYQHLVEQSLERGLRDENIEVYYQPILRTDGSLAALEALCRIYDKELGFIPPDMFISAAERNGSIVHVGQVVLDMVCNFLAGNRSKNWKLDYVGINLSAVQCIQEGLAEQICETLKKYGLPSSSIRFEVTETEALMSIPAARENMQKLIDNGFHFLLDDFGSGFSNFNYLADLPFECVKIDRSLLIGAQNGQAGMMLLTEICQLANQLGLNTICEGIETVEQAQLAGRLGVSMQQGWLYSKALPPDQIVEYVDIFMCEECDSE